MSAKAWIENVLDPINCNPVGAPDDFTRRTAVWRTTTTATLVSSVANGHVFVIITPQRVVSSTGAHYVIRSDSGTVLDVTNFSTATTATTVLGTDITTNYAFARLVGYRVRLIYIGAEQTGAGECSVALINSQPDANATNVSALVRDADFVSTGRAESEFFCNWIPQDISDLQLRIAGDQSAEDKSIYWGQIIIVGTGFPKATAVYSMEITAIIEGVVKATSADFIPRSISLPTSPTIALQALKRLIMNRPGLIAGNTHSCNPYMARAGVPGPGRPGPMNMDVDMGDQIPNEDYPRGEEERRWREEYEPSVVNMGQSFRNYRHIPNPGSLLLP